MRFLPAAILAFCLSACGGGANPDKEAANRIPDSQRVGAMKAEVLSGSPSFANGTLTGSGTVRFAEPLSGRDTAHNFAIRLELTDGESVTLIANASRELANGVELEISRPAGATNPRVIARAGADTLDLSGLFTGVSAAGPMSLAFDVHNNEGDTVHLVAFNDGNAGAELGSDVLRGKGIGANWGLRLAGGKVSGLEKTAPRDNH